MSHVDGDHQDARLPVNDAQLISPCQHIGTRDLYHHSFGPIEARLPMLQAPGVRNSRYP
jgi:hypothetical protein